MPEPVEIVCPRCGQTRTERFYGPCTPCRETLRSLMVREATIVEVPDYEPKVNVTPNQVATKD